MADKTITELPVASAIGATDVSVLVSNNVDYQFDFALLLQFISTNISTGASITFGAVVPQNNSGKNGDVFFKTDVPAFYQKTNGSWPQVYALPTSTTSGSALLYGEGMPGSTIGTDSDSYLNTTTGIFYLRTAGTWAQVFSMATGPQGPQGTAGTNGTNGTNGNTLLSGATNPSNANGNNGDYYINLSTYALFGPKTTGAWGTGVSLIGDTGPAGPQGIAGASGANGTIGATGATGPGVSAGGTAGQVLSKIDSSDYNTQWINPPAGGGGSTLSGIATGTNTYITEIVEVTEYNALQEFFIQFTNANTGLSTLNINNLGAIAIVKNGQYQLEANDILAKQILAIVYDGTNFQIGTTLSNVLPTVTTGEKVVSVTPVGAVANYDLVSQIVSSDALTAADFSTGVAAVTGQQGQMAYDSNFVYYCVADNQWRRTPLNSNVIDLYLADIDDTEGDQTSSQLQAAYPSSVVGQQAWGINKLYIKKTLTGWKKIATADA